MMKKTLHALMPLLVLAGTSLATSAMATTCTELPTRQELKQLLVQVRGEDSGGLGMPLWLTLVDTSGTVCAVVHSRDDSVDVTVELSVAHREFSAHKAFTSNAFSHSMVAIASGNLAYSRIPGSGSISDHYINEPTASILTGSPSLWGTAADPMVGQRVGGITGLGGGLPLFNNLKKKVGAIGVSGDALCTDHVVAWKIRERLADGAYSGVNVPFGVAADFTDKLIQDLIITENNSAGFSPSTYGHPTCRNNPTPDNDGGSIEYHGLPSP
jgi:uncharacterized protein GlcG (DUF336 family)